MPIPALYIALKLIGSFTSEQSCSPSPLSSAQNLHVLLNSGTAVLVDPRFASSARQGVGQSDSDLTQLSLDLIFRGSQKKPASTRE